MYPPPPEGSAWSRAAFAHTLPRAHTLRHVHIPCYIAPLALPRTPVWPWEGPAGGGGGRAGCVWRARPSLQACGGGGAFIAWGTSPGGATPRISRSPAGGCCAEMCFTGGGGGGGIHGGRRRGGGFPTLSAGVRGDKTGMRLFFAWQERRWGWEWVGRHGAGRSPVQHV